MGFSIYALFFLIIFARETYEEGESIRIFAHKLRSNNDPGKSKSYYYLDLCKPSDWRVYQQNQRRLSDIILNEEVVRTPLTLDMKKEEVERVWCRRIIDEEFIKQVKKVSKEEYKAFLLLDDMMSLLIDTKHKTAPDGSPYDEIDYSLGFNVTRQVRKEKKVKIYRLFTHLDLTVEYNDENIIHFYAKASKYEKISPGRNLTFTYSVKWKKTNVKWQNRWDIYYDLKSSRFEEQRLGLILAGAVACLCFLGGFICCFHRSWKRRVIEFREFKNARKRPEHVLIDLDENEENDDEESLTSSVSEVSRDQIQWQKLQEHIRGNVPRFPIFFSFITIVGFQSFLIFLCLLVAGTIGFLYGWQNQNIFIALTLITLVTESLMGVLAARETNSYQLSDRQKRDLVIWLILGLPFFIFLLTLLIFFYQFVVVAAEGDIAVSGSALLLYLVIFIVWVVVGGVFKFVGFKIFEKTPSTPLVLSPKKTEVSIGWKKNFKLFIYTTLISLCIFAFLEAGLRYLFSSLWLYRYFVSFGYLLGLFFFVTIINVITSLGFTQYCLLHGHREWQWLSMTISYLVGIYIFIFSIILWFLQTTDPDPLETGKFLTFSLAFVIFYSIAQSSLSYHLVRWNLLRDVNWEKTS